MRWKSVAATMLIFAAVACAKKNVNEIVIGEYSSMTGNTASFGQESHEGVMMAVDEANQTGGVLGKQIRLVLEDDQSRPEEAKAVVLKLIQRHKVVALIGEVSSGRTLAAAPEAQKRKIPMISPFSTNPKVTEIGDYIFRACYIDPFQGEQTARFAVEKLKLKRFAILKDVRSDYSVGLAHYFSDTVKKLGAEVVAMEGYGEGDVEFRSQLTTIKATAPDAIYIPGYYTEVGLIARQARELGIRVPLLGGDGWDSPKVIEIGGKAVDGSYYSTAFVADDPDPAVQEFIKKYEWRHHRSPSGIVVMGYEAARLLIDAIRRAGTTDAAKIRDALADTRDFKSVTGTTTMGPDRNVRKRLVIVKIADGKPRFFAAINP